MNFKFKLNRQFLLAGASACIIAGPLASAPAHAVVPNDTQTPSDILDNETDLTGVGMFVIEYTEDNTTYYGSCTGTLINPRTVLFAAHCVNDVPANALGSNLQAGMAFQADATAGVTHLVNNGFSTNTARSAYSVNQINWHPDSVARSEAAGFLEADVALATLDTPAANVPTWVTLFAPLPTPDQIDPETGTGYHVNLAGYGRTGSGTEGSNVGLDYRRRAAENMLGALTSLDEFDELILGRNSNLPALLYQIDFDDPDGTSQFDYNLLRDEPLPEEGFGGPGDSGGPLILDAANNPGFSEDLLIGVYSGSRRFFNDAAQSGYGSTGLYQPIFAYWDWIAENSSYRYVGAAAGSGDWEDPAHWTSLQDPNFKIIDSNGNVVTGLPDRPGAGIEANGPGFGQACIDEPPRDTPIGFTNCADASPNGSDEGWLSPNALPNATIENGLPGATNFVPNNREPDPNANVAARYFDVTLSEPGTTSLSSRIEIDRLTLSGDAGLHIARSGHLISLMDITQTSATSHVSVDGTLSTPGDYLLMRGWLSGSGEIEVDYLTNVSGIILPGGNNSPDTLIVDGSVILSSGSILAIDINGQSNKPLVVLGDISLGGTLALIGQTQYGNRHEVVLYVGEATGAFNRAVLPKHLGVLTVNTVYEDGRVFADISATSLAAHLPTRTSLNQNAVGRALDAARETNYDALKSVYQPIDQMDSTTLASTFEQMVPSDALLAGQTMREMGVTLDRRVRKRLRRARRNRSGFSVSGSSDMLTQTAVARQSHSNLGLEQLASLSNLDSKPESERVNGFGGFASISRFAPDSLAGFSATQVDMEGYSITGGLDRALSNGAVIGMLASHSRSDGISGLESEASKLDGTTFGFYGTTPFWGATFIDGYVSVGQIGTYSNRVTILAEQTETSTGLTNAQMTMSSVTFGREFELDGGMNVTPMVQVYDAKYAIDGYEEHGSVFALNIDAREVSTTQLKLGARMDWTRHETDGVYPSLSVSWVQDLAAETDEIRSRFTAAPEATEIVFRGAPRRKDWLEIDAHLAIQYSEALQGSFGLTYSDNAQSQSETMLGGAVRLRF